jgi:hypothetical protein
LEVVVVALVVVVLFLISVIFLLQKEVIFWKGAFRHTADNAGIIINEVVSGIEGAIIDGSLKEGQADLRLMTEERREKFRDLEVPESVCERHTNWIKTVSKLAQKKGFRWVKDESCLLN